MRTTLAIDDDVLAAAKHLAEHQSKSLGEVVSELARQGLAKAKRAARPTRNGLLLLPTKGPGGSVTLELVNQLRDDLP